MESTEENTHRNPEEKRTPSTPQRRSEIRRRKLLMNSEDRMNRILGFAKPVSENNGASSRAPEPRFHLDLDSSDAWRSPPPAPTRLSPFTSDVSSSHPRGDTPERRGSPQPDSSEILGGVGGMSMDDEVGMGMPGVRQGSSDEPGRSSPRRGLQKYLYRFDDAMKLRGQLANEKAARDGATEQEELDFFRVFRLGGTVLLALFVRVFACNYLSIFAPFLTLELAYMGLFKYFPKVEKKMQNTVLTAALLLSGIPAEVISRSMDTYRRMGDVFSDLCLYFFTFVLCHEILLLIGSEPS